MVKVFVSGSIGIKNLDDQVKARISNIVDSGYKIIVGDANGVDSSIQEYLTSTDSSSVSVYCSGTNPRNNLGGWPTQQVHTEASPGTRAFFTAKDKKMAQDCDYGLMVWDAKSTGTLSNALELVGNNKTALVYVNKAKEFLKIKEVADLENLVSYMSSTSFHKADKKLKLKEKIQSMKHRQESLL